MQKGRENKNDDKLFRATEHKMKVSFSLIILMSQARKALI